MSTFSQRKMQAAKDHLMQNMTDAELDELEVFLRRRPRKVHTANTSTQTCSLLKLPAEILNYIYEYVAVDAHDKTATPHIKDAEGKKVRPGLLGTCYQIHQEFFSVFWSSKYIRCEMACKYGKIVVVEEPKLLYTILHQLHGVKLYGVKDYGNPDQRIHDMVIIMKNWISSQYLVSWSGTLTFQGEKKNGLWSEFLLHTTKTDHASFERSKRCLRHIELQGLTLQARPEEKDRVLWFD